MFQSLAFAFASACASSGDETVAPPKQDWFVPPARLNAGGKPIEHGAAWGHCGPTLHDMDGDGVNDLVVGDYSGRFTVYRNVGSAELPEFTSGVLLKAGGVDAHVPIACCIGSSPRFADLDGDGITDLLSGCYDPGTFWLFPAIETDGTRGEFEKGRELTGSDGRKLLRKPDQTQNLESFGSWLDAVDWDDDGDLDLVCGGLGGELFVFVNDGTRTTPSYAPTPAFIKRSDGSLAHVPGNHGAVVAADWDGDGLFDLVCGSASGAVVWFRNVGKRGQPLLAPPETLVPASSNRGTMVWLEPGAHPQPGICVQIDVVDWNGDGKQDLLVGDFCTTVTPRPDLTDEQKRAVASLRLQRDSADAENRAGVVWDELTKFLQKVPGKPGHDDWQQPHGWVWLYTRK